MRACLAIPLICGLLHENGMALAQSQNAKDRALRDTLSSLSGPLFDNAFVSALMDNYRDAIQQFQKEADTGSNEKVKAFAARTLLVVREHLRLTEDAASKLGFNPNQTGGQRP